MVTNTQKLHVSVPLLCDSEAPTRTVLELTEVALMALFQGFPWALASCVPSWDAASVAIGICNPESFLFARGGRDV